MKKILSILLLSIFIVSCWKSEDTTKSIDDVKVKVEKQNLPINNSLWEF